MRFRGRKGSEKRFLEGAVEKAFRRQKRVFGEYNPIRVGPVRSRLHSFLPSEEERSTQWSLEFRDRTPFALASPSVPRLLDQELGHPNFETVFITEGKSTQNKRVQLSKFLSEQFPLGS